MDDNKCFIWGNNDKRYKDTYIYINIYDIFIYINIYTDINGYIHTHIYLYKWIYIHIYRILSRVNRTTMNLG